MGETVARWRCRVIRASLPAAVGIAGPVTGRCWPTARGMPAGSRALIPPDGKLRVSGWAEA